MAGDDRHQRPALQADNLQEQRFYIVMHHLATVLWMKGAAVEGLAALSAVVEWVVEQEQRNGPHQRG